MGCYIYSGKQSSKTPPAPILQIQIGHPSNSSNQVTCNALIDTGADFTFIPEVLLARVDVRPYGKPKTMQGAANGEAPTIRCKVAILIDGKFYPSVTVWSWATEENIILIGRDLLNLCYSKFDGPSLMFYVDHS
jgi:predicted aspartyl protease